MVRAFTHERGLLVLAAVYFIACTVLLLYLREAAVETIEKAALARAQGGCPGHHGRRRTTRLPGTFSMPRAG